MSRVYSERVVERMDETQNIITRTKRGSALQVVNNYKLDSVKSQGGTKSSEYNNQSVSSALDDQDKENVSIAHSSGSSRKHKSSRSCLTEDVSMSKPAKKVKRMHILVAAEKLVHNSSHNLYTTDEDAQYTTPPAQRTRSKLARRPCSKPVFYPVRKSKTPTTIQNRISFGGKTNPSLSSSDSLKLHGSPTRTYSTHTADMAILSSPATVYPASTPSPGSPQPSTMFRDTMV